MPGNFFVLNVLFLSSQYFSMQGDRTPSWRFKAEKRDESTNQERDRQWHWGDDWLLWLSVCLWWASQAFSHCSESRTVRKVSSVHTADTCSSSGGRKRSRVRLRPSKQTTDTQRYSRYKKKTKEKGCFHYQQLFCTLGKKNPYIVPR